ncbi:arginine--tRNA ligase [Halobacteriales archaeon QH_8_64_26]|nr:MAG: arginine--tRNA ligase [Halobacteriales archaeon QH_8_64_26]
MFVSLREEAEDALRGALSSLSLPTTDLGIEEPPEDVPAVLASSVAFRLAGERGTPPPQVASEIASEIDLAEYDYLDAISTQDPYLNFTPSEAYYADTLEAAGAADYGRLPAREESVAVEHTSANPTGPVHIGRARNPIVGDAIARTLDLAGYDVARHYYVNDAGRQIALFAWAYEAFEESDLPDPERDRADCDLVRYYRTGNSFLEDADDEARGEAEAEIEALMQGLEAGETEAYERVSRVVDEVLGGMQASLQRLPATFEEFVKETRFMRNGSTEAIVARLENSPYAEREEGAWQLDLAEWDIEKPFVFLRSDGTSLYTTRDLAHHEWKFANFDRAVTVLGEDQKLHASQLEAALEILGNDTGRLTSTFYSWVDLPEGGMSTREGTGVDLDDLLDEAIARAREEVEDRLGSRIRDDDLDDADLSRIARQVGIGAVRYDIVAKQPTKAITFEWDRALDFEAQSAPYVQYVHARACGILAEAGRLDGNKRDPFAALESMPGSEEDSRGAPPVDPETIDALDIPEERALLEVIARFPAVVETAAEDLTPHTIATYTREIAEAFNAFYRECPVLDAPEELKEGRLALVVLREKSRNGSGRFAPSNGEPRAVST